MTTTQSQLEDLIVELLQRKNYSITRLPNGLQLSKGSNVYVINAVSQVASTTSFKFR